MEEERKRNAEMRLDMKEMNGTILVIVVLVTLVAQCGLAGVSAQEFSIGVMNQLYHRDHVSLSRASTPRSLYERSRAAVERSHTRHWQIAKHTHAPRGLKSPVSADNGEYLMEISIGTPQQKFWAIVDTGSDLVWVQCLPCKSCYNQTEPFFDPLKSKTYSKVSCANSLCTALPKVRCSKQKTCEYVYQYGDGSGTQGDFSYETVTLSRTKRGHSHIPKIAFGCGQSQQGDFLGAGGLVGMGKGPNSLPSQLASTNITNKLSYCLVNLQNAASVTSPIILGDAVSTNVTGIAYTPLLSNPVNPTFYYVGIKGISIDGKLLNLNESLFTIQPDGSGGTILDSGTTLTYLTHDVYLLVSEIFQSANTYPVILNSNDIYGIDLCVDVSGIANATFPNLVMHFDGFDLFSPQENTWIPIATDVLCLAMADGGFNVGIIGNIQQQDHLVVYDNIKEQVGFKAVDCTTLH